MSTAEAREQAAAGWFTIAMGLVFGGAGIILAALAVAVDYTLKRDTKRTRGDWWRQSVDDSQAWLDQDRAWRQGWRAARREWWRNGADQDAKPATPSRAERLGRWARRRHARATVHANQAGGAFSRFRRGFLAGFAAADQVRRDGGSFRDITRARPEPKAAEEAAPESSDASDNQSEGDAPAERTPAAIWMSALNDLMTRQPAGPEPTADPANNGSAEELSDLKAGVHRVIDAERARRAALSPDDRAAEEAERDAFNRDRAAAEAERLRQLGVAPAGAAEDDDLSPEEDLAMIRRGREDMAVRAFEMFGRCRAPGDEYGMCGQPVEEGENHGGREGNPYCAYHTAEAEQRAASPRNEGTGDQHMTAPVGETHLDLTAHGLGEVNATLSEVEQHNDALGALRVKLQMQVQALSERVAANGGTAQTQQALDEANTVIEMIGQHVGNLADASANASDQAAAAEAGLAPARDAQDALHTAGARGEFVSTATS